MAIAAGLADTSLFVARENGREVLASSLPARLAVSAITIGELRAGVLAAADHRVRDQRLATYVDALRLDPVPVDVAVAEAWARLRVDLAAVGRRLGVNDSWIAATAISLGVPIVTQDSDYDDVPGLEVVRV